MCNGAFANIREAAFQSVGLQIIPPSLRPRFALLDAEELQTEKERKEKRKRK